VAIIHRKTRNHIFAIENRIEKYRFVLAALLYPGNEPMDCQAGQTHGKEVVFNE
jgi:hypothetical protein